MPYPEIDRVVACRRDERTARIFDDDVQRQAFRREVEETLGPDAVAALRAGNADALAPILDDRTEQLRAALAYLKSEPDSVVTHGDAIRCVIAELVDREIDAERLVLGHTHRQGLTH